MSGRFGRFCRPLAARQSVRERRWSGRRVVRGRFRTCQLFRISELAAGRRLLEQELHEALGRLSQLLAAALHNADRTLQINAIQRARDECAAGDLAIDRIETSELVTDAVRPAWSVLDTARAESLGVKLRSWQDAVTAYLRSPHSPLAARAQGPAHG